MSNGPSQAVLAAARRRQQQPVDPGALEHIRQAARDARAAERRIQDLEEHIKSERAALNEMQHVKIPDLMIEAGVDKLGVPAQGNEPAFDVSLKDYYNANIGADWPPERREAAFKLLEERGAGDVVRNQFTLSTARGEQDRAATIRAVLEEHGLAYEQKQSVPWNTLTAWLRETIQRDGVTALSTDELAKLGATVGRVAKMKERKDGV